MDTDSAFNAQQVLDRILAALRYGTPEEKMAALREIPSLNYSSSAVLGAVEFVLLSNPGDELSEAARLALLAPAHRFLYSRDARLSSIQRRLVLSELKKWQADGLINKNQAAVLEARYGFDSIQAQAPAPKPMPTPSIPAQEPAPQKPPAAEPEHPRPSLAQTLLSETSIKIALYLGAFLVIAAAAILAALVEAARLPILAGVTLAFGLASGFTRSRLPQPSFVLFIVFSCLIPFDANVMRDTLKIGETTAALYWAGTYLLLTLIWAFATWFFSSRFFSIAAFITLDISIGFFSTSLDLGTKGAALLFALAGLIGLAGVFVLHRIWERKFATPLFLTTLLHTALLGLFLSIATQIPDFSMLPRDMLPFSWVIASLGWILIASYFVAADQLYRFGLFPLLAAFSLLPLPGTLLRFFDPPAPVFMFGYGMLAALYALLSDVLPRSGTTRWSQYHRALLVMSYPALVIAWFAAGNQGLQYEFGIALGATIVFGLLTLRRPLRWFIWSTALLCGLAAFLIFFRLPIMERFSIEMEYPLAAACLLLFLSDLLMRPDLSADRSLRWPARVLALVLFLLVISALAASEFSSAAHRAAVWLLLALVALGYTLRYRKPWMPYLFAALLPFSLLEILDQLNASHFLPYFMGLAALYYMAGLLLRPWLAAPLRYSGLALGSLVVLVGLFGEEHRDVVWYSLLVTALFTTELFRFRQPWVEAGVPIFASIAWWVGLERMNIYEAGYAMTGVTVVWIAFSYLVDRTYQQARPLRKISNIAAAVIAAFSSLVLFAQDARVAAIGFAILTAVFLANAVLRRSPRLGYSAAASLPLTVIFILRSAHQARWLFPLIGIALLYFILGFFMRGRFARVSHTGWAQTLTFSGLALGSLVAISAPFEEPGLQAAIPVALSAVLWTVEAFERRNVWLGFPSNALYLMSYFMILSSLHVDEPQFYSVGAAALGLLMHYLLNRAGSRTAAFITGLLSQLVLLSTTYYQMLTTEKLGFFAVLFFQGLAVLAYGIVIRSRSLVITPIIFVVLGVVTVIYSALKGISTVILIGCTGILLLLLGIFAVMLRDRFIRISERLSDWQA